MLFRGRKREDPGNEVVAATECWDRPFKLDSYSINEIRFWDENMRKANVKYCFTASTPKCFAYSDASSTGCGAYTIMNQEFVCHNMWTEEEKRKSSTWRELSAIEFALSSFVSVLNDSHVKWFTDNQAAAKIVEVGNMRQDLQLIALKIFNICIQQ